MSSLLSELNFWEKLKSSFISTKNLESQKTSVEENTYLKNSFSTTGSVQDQAYGNSKTISNKEISTLRYITDKEHNPYSLININPGVPQQVIDSDSKSKYGGCKVQIKPCERTISFPTVPGYKGWGTRSGDVETSSTLRNKEETNTHKTLDPEIFNYTEYTFQPFNKLVEDKIKPYGSNGDQNYVRGGDISRLI